MVTIIYILPPLKNKKVGDLSLLYSYLKQSILRKYFKIQAKTDAVIFICLQETS